MMGEIQNISNSNIIQNLSSNLSSENITKNATGATGIASNQDEISSSKENNNAMVQLNESFPQLSQVRSIQVPTDVKITKQKMETIENKIENYSTNIQGHTIALNTLNILGTIPPKIVLNDFKETATILLEKGINLDSKELKGLNELKQEISNIEKNPEKLKNFETDYKNVISILSDKLLSNETAELLSKVPEESVDAVNQFFPKSYQLALIDALMDVNKSASKKKAFQAVAGVQLLNLSFVQMDIAYDKTIASGRMQASMKILEGVASGIKGAAATYSTVQTSKATTTAEKKIDTEITTQQNKVDKGKNDLIGSSSQTAKDPNQVREEKTLQNLKDNRDTKVQTEIQQQMARTMGTLQAIEGIGTAITSMISGALSIPLSTIEAEKGKATRLDQTFSSSKDASNKSSQEAKEEGTNALQLASKLSEAAKGR